MNCAPTAWVCSGRVGKAKHCPPLDPLPAYQTLLSTWAIKNCPPYVYDMGFVGGTPLALNRAALAAVLTDKTHAISCRLAHLSRRGAAPTTRLMRFMQEASSGRVGKAKHCPPLDPLPVYQTLLSAWAIKNCPPYVYPPGPIASLRPLRPCFCKRPIDWPTGCRRVRAESALLLVENDGFIGVKQYAVFDMPAHRARQHHAFQIPALLNQVLYLVAM